ncbi:DNA excision repair protein ERCC-1 [Citrus sinensis]|nr:DNA excision repair protein ERCC-1 [Citrus sinensis]
MENEEQNNESAKAQPPQNKKKTIITIPSYQEVINATNPPQNLFTPSQSFSQAFSFIKSSEFYNPPPPPPANPPTTSQNPTLSQGGEQNVGTASASASSSQSIQSRNAILVSQRQKGNPLLKYIRNVRWAFADVVCDYLLGQNSCALYLSLEECGRYLETIKVYENKPADLIQGQMDTDYLSRLTHALTSVRSVNKTDVVTLGSTFGSLLHIMDASMEDLARCPGIGERKVKRLYDTFHEPFKRVVSSHPPIPETPSQKDVERSSVNEVTEVEKDTEDVNKRRKKETESTVKSALSAAFAKYADKIGKKQICSSQVGETSVSNSGAENSNSGQPDS